MLKLLPAAAPALILFVTACSGGSSSAGTPAAVAAAGDCSQAEAVEIKEAVDPLIERFNEANTEASVLPKEEVLPFAEEMREVSDDFAALELPSCGQLARDTMVDYIDLNVQLYTEFAEGASDARVKQLLDATLAAQMEPEGAWALIFDMVAEDEEGEQAEQPADE